MSEFFVSGRKKLMLKKKKRKKRKKEKRLSTHLERSVLPAEVLARGGGLVLAEGGT